MCILEYADTKPRDKKMQQILFKPYLSVLHSAASVTPNRVHYLTEVQRKSSGLSQPLSMVLILLSTVDSVQLLSVVLILSCVRFCRLMQIDFPVCFASAAQLFWKPLFRVWIVCDSLCDCESSQWGVPCWQLYIFFCCTPVVVGIKALRSIFFHLFDMLNISDLTSLFSIYRDENCNDSRKCACHRRTLWGNKPRHGSSLAWKRSRNKNLWSAHKSPLQYRTGLERYNEQLD